MKTLDELKREILEDGIIDADEVIQLKSVLYADGVIDSDEANFLFDLNDAVSNNDNHISWNSFFIEAITDYLLEDETSPGEIDKDETNWLIERIKGDGQIDKIEKELLINLKNKAKSFPAELENLI